MDPHDVLESCPLCGGRNSIREASRGKDWIDTVDGEPTSTHRTQTQAIERGHVIAMPAGVLHVIHGRGGQIREERVGVALASAER